MDTRAEKIIARSISDRRDRLARSAARKEMGLDECAREWGAKRRHMGCVAATNFVCSRVPGFRPVRLQRWLEDGTYWEHEVATNGEIVIDLVPHCDAPDLY